MKKLGNTLIIVGLIIFVTFAYQYKTSLNSVRKIDSNILKENINDRKSNDQIVKVDENLAQPAFGSGDKVADLVIPKINLAFDVFWGTDDKTLAKGVGMYDSKWTRTPDVTGHTFLSGHRDTVFRQVGDLVIGDKIYLNYSDVDYEYEIFDIWVTDENDHTVIVEKDEAILTLSTCYPFYFIGNAPERYIVQAKLINKGDLLNLLES